MKNERLPKLIAGEMNIPYIICKPGFADGVQRPRKEVAPVVKLIVTKLRKNEKLVA